MANNTLNQPLPALPPGMLSAAGRYASGTRSVLGGGGMNFLAGNAMETVWQDWLTLRADADIWHSTTRTQILQPYTTWWDLEGLDSITITANIPFMIGTGLKLLLGTSSSPGGAFAPIVDLAAAIVTAPGTTSVNIVISGGHVRLPDTYPGTPNAAAVSRYLSWTVIPPTTGDWELTFQLLATPKGRALTSSPGGRDRFATRDIQPYTSIRARGFATPRAVIQPPSMWLDTRGLTSLGLNIDLLRLADGMLQIQTAFSANQVEWTTALSLAAQGASGVVRFHTLYLNRDSGAAEKTLQNFLRWQIIQTTSGTGAVVTGCLRITGGGSTR